MSRLNEIKINIGEGYAWILFEVVLITIHIWVTGVLTEKKDKNILIKIFMKKIFLNIKD